MSHESSATRNAAGVTGLAAMTIGAFESVAARPVAGRSWDEIYFAYCAAANRFKPPWTIRIDSALSSGVNA